MATMNGMPRVTQDCTVAVMQKAVQIDMADFGVQVLDELAAEQPNLCHMVTWMTMDLACPKEMPEEDRSVEIDLRRHKPKSVLVDNIPRHLTQVQQEIWKHKNKKK